MQKPLQSAGDLLDRLLAPATLLQLAAIAGAILLGWWIARLLRPRLAVTMAPDDLPFHIVYPFNGNKLQPVYLHK